MRILFITRKYPPSVGGMETFSADFSRAFAQTARVIALGRSQIHVLWWLPWQMFYLPWVIRRFDVVHLGDGVLTILALWLRIWSKTPVTVTLHGLDVTYANKLYQWYIWFMLPYCAGIVCVSEYTAELVRAKLPKTEVMVIGNGVWFDDVSTITTTNPSSENIQLLTVGRLVARKGVAWFIEHVWAELPDSYHYTIVGEGSDRPIIERAINALPSASRARIHLKGKIEQSELDVLLASVDIFVMPNQSVPGNVEGFGIVALEAQQFGVPVVASALEGITDALVDGETGLLVHSNTAATWKKAIFTCKSMKKSDVQRVARQHFDWPIIQQKYEAFFNQLHP